MKFAGYCIASFEVGVKKGVAKILYNEKDRGKDNLGLQWTLAKLRGLVICVGYERCCLCPWCVCRRIDDDGMKTLEGDPISLGR